MVRPSIDDANNLAEYNPNLRPLAKGQYRNGKLAAWTTFPPALFNQIRDEAMKRGWSFNRMVVHLCDSSIDGIE